MMHLQASNLIYVGVLITYIGIRGFYAQQAKHNTKVSSRVDARERIMVLAVFVASTLLPVIYLFTPFLAFGDYHLPPAVTWSGAVIGVAALWLFWRSHVDLGRNWSITLEMRDGHELVTRGVYRSIRHPMYAALWLLSLAQGLLVQNWLAGWAALAAFATLYFVRVPREEEMMSSFFGDSYDSYARSTGRIIPRIGSRPNQALQPTADRGDA